jgi:hypothetical protein
LFRSANTLILLSPPPARPTRLRRSEAAPARCASASAASAAKARKKGERYQAIRPCIGVNRAASRSSLPAAAASTSFDRFSSNRLGDHLNNYYPSQCGEYVTPFEFFFDGPLDPAGPRSAIGPVYL